MMFDYTALAARDEAEIARLDAAIAADRAQYDAASIEYHACVRSGDAAGASAAWATMGALSGPLESRELQRSNAQRRRDNLLDLARHQAAAGHNVVGIKYA